MLVGLLMKVSSPFDTLGGHRMLQVWVPLCPPAVRGQLHDKIQLLDYQTSRRAEILRSPDSFSHNDPVIHLLPIYHDLSVRRMSPMLTFNDFTILDLSLHAIGGNTAHSFVAA